MQRTSSASISSPGIASAWARSESSRLRLSWKASVRWAPGSTRIIPRQTAVASSRGRRGRRGRNSCRARHAPGSCRSRGAGLPLPDVGPGHLRGRAAAGELRLHPNLAARGAEAQGDPLEVRLATDLGALGREDPAVVGELLLADVAEVRAVAEDELGDSVEEHLAVGGVALPDLGLGAVLEHDQRPPFDRLAGGAVDRRAGSARRAAPRRGRGRARRRASEPSLRATKTSSAGTIGRGARRTRSGVALGSLRERHDDRAAGAVVASMPSTAAIPSA